MSSTTPRTSFDSTTTSASTIKPLIAGTNAKKSSSVAAKVKSAFGKLKPSKSSPPAEGGASEEDKKEKTPKSVKEGSFGGEASHLRMQM